MIRFEIPGEPHAQGRGRAFGFVKNGKVTARVFDPKKSRDWKATAQQHMRDAVESAIGVATRGPLFAEGPLVVRVTAVWTLARSHWRKTAPVARAWKDSKPDPDNVGKAVMDAGNGILWTDDSQIAILLIARARGAQGESPRTTVEVFRADVIDPNRPLWTHVLQSVTPAGDLFDVPDPTPEQLERWKAGA